MQENQEDTYVNVRIKRSVYNNLKQIGVDAKKDTGVVLSVPQTVEKLANDKLNKAAIARDEKGKFLGKA